MRIRPGSRGQKVIARLAGRVLCTIAVVMSFAAGASNVLAAASPQEFYDKYIGEPVDVDNYPVDQPYQCYDLWAQFVMDEYGTSSPIIISPTGLAKDIWNNFDGLGLSTYFTKVSGDPQDGDWVVYDCPAFTHVGMFRWDNDDETITILHQNYLGQTKVTQDIFTKKNILGYLRPNIYLDEAPEAPVRVTISMDKSELQAGETATFSFRAAKATAFIIEVYKDGIRKDTKDCGSSTSYTRTFPDSGNYSVYVRAYKGKDSLGMERVTFTVAPKETRPETAGEPLVSRYKGPERERPITVMVNGSPVVFDESPVILNGRTMVPMRAIFEALETPVNWEVGKQTATATKGKTTNSVTIGSQQAVINGREKLLDAPAQLINNRTLVPVRFISESLGAEVDWVISTQTVMISQKPTKQ